MKNQPFSMNPMYIDDRETFLKDHNKCVKAQVPQCDQGMRAPLLHDQRIHRHRYRWKPKMKKSSSGFINLWKNVFDGGSRSSGGGKMNFSHSFLLIVAYLIIEVAAFKQNFGGRTGRNDKLFCYLYFLFVSYVKM